MCFQSSNIINSTRKSWDGDEIILRPIVKAARFVPATQKSYEIDIRAFLSSTSNAVVVEKCCDAMDMLPSLESQALVRSHKSGSFDLRVRAVCNYLAQTLEYKPRKASERTPDQWLFPDETLANSGGDCEDHAFLLAAMLLSSGVSGYVVRVALGRIRNLRTGRTIDHAWVVYKTESGQWIVLDPLIYTAQGHKSSQAAGHATELRTKSPRSGEHHELDGYDYLPRFVFNDAHLWAVRAHPEDPDFDRYVRGRSDFWHGFDPSFAAAIHNSIFDRTLGTMSWVNRQYVKAVSVAVDANLTNYDPRDHFDNGYITEGWRLVQQRLGTGNLNDFALACHAIGDFYAHSSWGLFGTRCQGKLQPYEIGESLPISPEYGPTGPLPFTDTSRFSVNERVWVATRAEAAAAWRGKLISGRYAQNDDPHQGFFEKLTYIPATLRNRSDYKNRTGLPHHNEMSVDSASKAPEHRLYADAAQYSAAFRERFDVASRHIAAVYERWVGRETYQVNQRVVSEPNYSLTAE